MKTLWALRRRLLIGVLLLAQACATQGLWRYADPNERIWIDAGKITEARLQARGIRYEISQTDWGSGYLIEKSGWEKMKDYHLRLLGTPVTLALDAATTVVVVGVYLFLNDPQGTCDLIEALAH